jgi:hypothetical protein
MAKRFHRATTPLGAEASAFPDTSGPGLPIDIAQIPVEFALCRFNPSTFQLF